MCVYGEEGVTGEKSRLMRTKPRGMRDNSASSLLLDTAGYPLFCNNLLPHLAVKGNKQTLIISQFLSVRNLGVV